MAGSRIKGITVEIGGDKDIVKAAPFFTNNAAFHSDYLRPWQLLRYR